MSNSTDDSKQFAIIDLIVAFCWAKGFGEIEARMVVAIVVFLKENSSSSDKGGIGGNSELLLRVRVAENGGNAEGFFNFVDSLFLRL